MRGREKLILAFVVSVLGAGATLVPTDALTQTAPTETPAPEQNPSSEQKPATDPTGPLAQTIPPAQIIAPNTDVDSSENDLAIVQDESEARLVVSVVLNGQRVADSVLAVRRADGFYLPRDALTEMRIVTGGTAITIPSLGSDYVSLSSIPGITVEFDAGEQELALTVDAMAMDRQVLDLASRPAIRTMGSATGGFFNYDTVLQGGTDRTFAAGLFEAGSPILGGSLETTALSRSFGSGSGLVRLETAYVHEVPSDLMRFKVGDGISRGGDWGRPFRFGGFQIASDFTVQPGFVPYPTAGFTGQAALPSTVDIFVNDALRYRGTIESGPFQLNQIPTTTGGGEARVVLTDPLGRQEAASLPFYVSPALLRDGVSDFSYTAGFLRNNLTVRSAEYDVFAITGTHRYGLANNHTVEGHATATFDSQVVGLSLTSAFAGWGEFHEDLAFARSDEAEGWLAGLGWSLTQRNWNIGVRQRWYSPEYERAQPIDSVLGTSKRSETLANLTSALAGYGTLSLSLARQTFEGIPSVTIGSANWSYPIAPGAFFSAYALQTRQDISSTTVGMTLTLFFGGNYSVSSDVYRRGSTTGGSVQARRSGTNDGWSYGAMVGKDNYQRASADISKRTFGGDFSLAVDQFRSSTNGRFQASGGIAMVEDKVFLSRRIDDSFGVVSVPGFAGVTILQDNRPIGVTDEDGDVFMPRLLSNYANKISIDPSTLPIEAQIAEVEQEVVPGHRSIALVKFEAKKQGGTLVIVKRKDGKPIETGVDAKRLRDGQTFPAGFDGEVYLDGTADDIFEVVESAGRCHFRLSQATVENGLPSAVCEAPL